MKRKNKCHRCNGGPMQNGGTYCPECGYSTKPRERKTTIVKASSYVAPTLAEIKAKRMSWASKISKTFSRLPLGLRPVKKPKNE